MDEQNSSPPAPRPGRRLPSLPAVRAFEAAARHLSFTRAAAELNVTQGAVSHAIKGLEQELGVALFERRARGLALTAAGAAVLPDVRDAFDRLAAGFAQLSRRDARAILTVSVSPNFAQKWLVPRLGRFVAAHPGIDLRIGATAQHVDFAREDVDVAVRHGDGRWPGLAAVPFMEEALFPVASPHLIARIGKLAAPADLLGQILLHGEDELPWRRWLATVGLPEATLGPGVVFNQVSLAIDAAVDGQGIAIARTSLVAGDLIAGRLVRPFAASVALGNAFWIVCPKAAARQAKVREFRAWLAAEAAADLAALRVIEARP